MLDRQQSREIDRIAIEEHGMHSLVLMENAGRGAADLLIRLGITGKVVICCGRGNNGGDGLVIARQLSLRGFDVNALLFGEPAILTPDSQWNFKAATALGIHIQQVPTPFDPSWLTDQLHGADWIVDGLLGTGARGEPRAPLDDVIEQLNRTNARRLALDLPSGLDCDSGTPASITFRADHTCTFYAQKIGFANRAAHPFLGIVHVADIGIPTQGTRTPIAPDD